MEIQELVNKLQKIENECSGSSIENQQSLPSKKLIDDGGDSLLKKKKHSKKDQRNRSIMKGALLCVFIALVAYLYGYQT